MAWDNGLDRGSVQYRIASYSERRPLHVLAGPGTGKSFAMKRRIARLLESGVDPERILVATFTRTTANDIVKDLTDIGIPGCENVDARTLHSLCFSILGRSNVLSATRRVPRTLLDFEKKALLRDLSDVFGDMRQKEKTLEAFAAAWARLQSDEPGQINNELDANFDYELNSWLAFHRAMLVEELVPVTRQYLYNNPLCPEREQYDYVLVDEYQDFNRAEQHLIRLLSMNGHLTVIGDEDQSIYGFKYAHPEGMIEFPHTYNGVTETMEECRRSPTKVVSMATSLIQKNKIRTNKNLLPYESNGNGVVHILQWRTLDEEALGLANLIKTKIENGEVEANQVLVLCPRRTIGYRIRNYLNDMGISAKSSFTEEALDSEKAKIVFSFLSLLADPHDRVSLRYLLGVGSQNLRAPAYARLRSYCENSGEAPWQVLEKLASREITIPHTAQLIKRFREINETLQQLNNSPIENLVDILISDLTDDVEELYSIIQASLEVSLDFRELFTEVKTKITQREIPEITNEVRIMSLHKSKGLSANFVVVAATIQGLIPNYPPEELSTVEEQKFMEEQRRLFYVSITRCKSNLPNHPGELILSSVRFVPFGEGKRMGLPDVLLSDRRASISSIFLSELGAHAPEPVAGSTLLQQITHV